MSVIEFLERTVILDSRGGQYCTKCFNFRYTCWEIWPWQRLSFSDHILLLNKYFISISASWLKLSIRFCNIASRTTQSNSVYVSVLQISTVPTELFFARAAIVSAGKKYYISLDWWIQRLGPLVSKQTQFSGLFSWARVFKWGGKREKQRKRKLDINAITIRFTVRKTLWYKAKQITNRSVSTF